MVIWLTLNDRAMALCNSPLRAKASARWAGVSFRGRPIRFVDRARPSAVRIKIIRLDDQTQASELKRSHLGDALGCARTGGAGRGRLEPFEAPSAWRQCRRKKCAGNQIGMLSLERPCAGFFDSIRRLPTFGEVQFSPTFDHVSQRKRVGAALFSAKRHRLAGHRDSRRKLCCLELHDLKF